MGDVVVRRIRVDEGAVLKSVRLAALADAPSAFGSSYGAEVDQPDEHWTARAAAGASGDAVVTFVATAGESVVGLVGGHRPAPGHDMVELVSMWVSPTQRRAGTGAALVAAVLGWADEIGARRVELWVTRGNDSAKRLYESAGFRPTGDHQLLPSDPCHDEIRMRRVLEVLTRPSVGA